MQAKVSFTQKVKEEICTVPFSDEHLRAILAAYIKVNGTVIFEGGKSQIVLKTENAKIAKFIFKSVEKVYGVLSRFAYSKHMGFKKRISYQVIIDEGDFLLDDLEISFVEGKISKSIVSNDEMIAGYICGAFLAAGSVNSPKKSNYHCEIALNDESFAKWFMKLFLKYKAVEFTPKMIKRRNYFVVYLKKSQQIADFLSLIGATQTMLEFEEVRIDRDFSSIGNRLSNLDAANYGRTTAAAEKQIEDIKLIDEKLGINSIVSTKQKELMKLRLEREDASLQELADALSDVLGVEVSRSNINHIFRAIHDKAEKLRGK